MEEIKPQRNRFRNILIYLSILVLGIIIGGYLFSNSLPRSFLNVTECNQTCLEPNELAGLIGSIGIQKLDGLIPKKIFETDKTIAIEHPFPQSKTHLVIIPKKDIKNIGEIPEGSEAYMTDVLAVIGQLVRDRGLKNYRVISYGPGLQEVAYLHFHLMSDKQ